MATIPTVPPHLRNINQQVVRAYLQQLRIDTTNVSLNATSKEITISNGDFSSTGGATIGIADNPTIPGTQNMTVPKGTTAGRPTGISGMLRFNTTDSLFEGYDGSNWLQFQSIDWTSATAAFSTTGTAATGNLSVTGTISVTSTVDGRDIATDGTKLDTIETNADVTDETNVTSALDGASLSSVTVATGDKVLVQDVDDSDNLKVVTAQSIANLASGLTQATQSAIEAETDENTYIPPDLVKHNPGIAKVWAVITETGGTPSLANSHNVDSITDDGVGQYTITITTDFSTATYAATVCGTEADIGEEAIVSKAVGSCAVKITDSSDTGFEDRGVDVCLFGDQ